MDNLTTLVGLLREGAIEIEQGALFDRRLAPKPEGLPFDRVAGCLLGIAIGDALGNTTEGLLPSVRAARFGEIRSYLPHKAVGREVGLPSDDTQLTFWTVAQLLADGGLVPEHLADRFCQGRIYGIGSAVSAALDRARAGVPWHRIGSRSAGNGALMRTAPMLLPHLAVGGNAIWADTALSTLLTHNDRAAISASLAWVAMLWELLDMAGPPPRGWWGERYCELARDLEGDPGYRPRGGLFTGYAGPAWRFVQECLAWADAGQVPVLDACNAWYSGAYLLETLPSVLYILMCHADDPEKAIVRAVNDTKDNDTVAAIVGAAVGALYGTAAYPKRWIEGLAGRTTDCDDGRVFALIEAARLHFWH